MKKIAKLFSLLMICVGLYALILFVYPFTWLFLPGDKTNISSENFSRYDQPMVFIPTIKLAEQIYLGEDESTLDKGVWLKYDQRSNPELGGNTVLTAHRFNFGLTPGMIKRQSPFFHVESLKVGDEIAIVWNKRRYDYRVTELKTVRPNQVEVEENTQEPMLTIYTCTLGGKYDGRSVIIAKPIAQ
jgi:LPXTG-site transpeptidase (sortase) family protein